MYGYSTERKHLKCFLQTSSWLRRFIPNYAEVARLLTNLLKKTSSWKWDAEHQAAFEHIKSLLLSAPILRQADKVIETPRKNRWILIVEDVCSRWVELFPLESATSAECAQTLTNVVFLPYGVPRHLVSDNGVQFVSEVIQQVCHALGITQLLTPYATRKLTPSRGRIETSNLSWMALRL